MTTSLVNILVVDDTPDNLRLLSTMLGEQGYKVRQALNAQIALTTVQRVAPDLILLDINMPGMNGYQLCERLKADEATREIPVIFISALNDVLDKVKAFKVGGVDYITKPFQGEEVLARIEHQLTIRRQQKQLSEQQQQLSEQNERLQKEIRVRIKAEEEIKLLLTITQAINEAPDFNAALEVALRNVCEVTGWNYGEAWIPSIDETALQCSPAWYCEKTFSGLEEFREYSEGLTLLPGEELPGRVWHRGEPEWIADVSTEANDVFLRAQLAIDCGLKAGFGVPIVASPGLATRGVRNLFKETNPHREARVLAVLVFLMLESRQQDRRLVKLVSAVAAQIGTVMQQKQTEAELRALFAAMTDAVMVIDAQGCYLKIAPTNPTILQPPAEELVGKTLHEVFDREQADLFISHIWQSLNTKETVDFEYSSNLGAGDIWLGARISPISEDMVIWVTRDITDRKQAELELQIAQQKSEELLLNILPEAIADRLKQNTSAIAEQFDAVTILFADIVGFTPLSARMPPIELVSLLNQIFTSFDELAEKHGLEKIKTIGDAYMVAGGLPVPRADHVEAIAQMALDMQEAIDKFQADRGEVFQIRCGINTGPVVAGVIGTRKFIYDLWGDTVNVASRMESQGIPGRIQCTASTYKCLKDKFLFEQRGAIAVKGRGEMISYWLTGKVSGT